MLCWSLNPARRVPLCLALSHFTSQLRCRRHHYCHARSDTAQAMHRAAVHTTRPRGTTGVPTATGSRRGTQPGRWPQSHCPQHRCWRPACQPASAAGRQGLSGSAIACQDNGWPPHRRQAAGRARGAGLAACGRQVSGIRPAASAGEAPPPADPGAPTAPVSGCPLDQMDVSSLRLIRGYAAQVRPLMRHSPKQTSQRANLLTEPSPHRVCRCG